MKFTHQIMYLEDGERTTVHKDEVEKFRAKGYKFGPESRGAAKWDIKEGFAIEKYGKAYISKGRHKGDVAMIENTKGDTVNVAQKDVERYKKSGMKFGLGKDLENIK